jgi:predicted RecA/RadA family phage recombinase
MATNEVYERGTHLALAATDPTTPASGDPVIVGQLPGVALTDEDDDGVTTIVTEGVYDLSVKGTTGSDSAVAVGDIIYYVSGNTPKLSKTSSGVRFGYALGTVGAGATGTIPVKLGY